MDKLEQYLDQVCRSIGGPRKLRQHIRQELREHLGDAAAEHRAAGLPAEEALARALVDFGKPDEVRSELEALHGQRLMAVVIDKAMQWKEMTMRAKWLWASWAYLTLMGVIALEVLWIVFAAVFIVPKFQKLTQDGIIDPAIVDEQGVAWMPAFLNSLVHVVGNVPIWYVIVPAVAWGLFEWRVRSEHKPFMRLSALGTAALALAVVALLTAGTLVISFTLGVPAIGGLARPYALDRIAHVDTSLSALEEAMAKKDWEAMKDHAERGSQALDALTKSGAATRALTLSREPSAVEDLRAHLRTANACLLNARQAIREKDVGKLETALAKFRTSYSSVREAAKRSQQ